MAGVFEAIRYNSAYYDRVKTFRDQEVCWIEQQSVFSGPEAEVLYAVSNAMGAYITANVRNPTSTNAYIGLTGALDSIFKVYKCTKLTRPKIVDVTS